MGDSACPGGGGAVIEIAFAVDTSKIDRSMAGCNVGDIVDVFSEVK